jgi:phosphatidylglycerol---prolipoprotein diacylglyceryl transferase
MIPVLFRLGPFTVYSYGLMMAAGFLVADYVIARQCRERRIDPGYASSVVVWAAVLGISGARILDIFNNFGTYLADPWMMIFSGSGFVWYGGMLGVVPAIYLVARYYGVGFLTTADMCAPALAIGQAIGRLGCQLSGDGDWGLPSTVPWAMSYPKAIVGWNAETVLKLDDHWRLVSGYFPGVRVHPAPIYEAILYTLVFAVLWRLRNRGLADGRLLYLYFALAGAARFVVEFWRINPRVLWAFSEAQLIAMGMVAVGTAAWFYTRGEEQQAADAKTRQAARA